MKSDFTWEYSKDKTSWMEIEYDLGEALYNNVIVIQEIDKDDNMNQYLNTEDGYVYLKGKSSPKKKNILLCSSL